MCKIRTDEAAIIRQVWSSSKKAAKKATAYLILCEYYELQNQYGINGKHILWKYKEGKLMPEHML